MRKLVREATFGLTEIDNEDIWRCTTCGKCPQVCPRNVKQIESGVALRRLATEYGVFPHAAAADSVRGREPQQRGQPAQRRSKQASRLGEGPGVKRFKTEGTEILYSPGCYLSYDPRGKKIAKATVQILQAAGVDFGILGTEESCCGESIRKTGDEALFKTLAKSNIGAFIGNGVKKILVSSPHCYHSFKNEYPEFRVNFEVVHITQFIFQLIDEGRLKLTKPRPRPSPITIPATSAGTTASSRSRARR